MAKKIKLYHGTTHDFDAVDVTKGKPFKDFGMGFYLSPSRKHSVNLAVRNKAVETMRIKTRKKPINSDGAIDILINRIMPYQLPIQYFFGTQRAADLLVFKGRDLLRETV